MDVAMFRVFPGATLLAAADEPTLRASLEFMRQYEDGPSFLRYPRDEVASNPLQDNPPPFELGKANLVRPARGTRPELAILAYGTLLYNAAAAIDELAPQGYNIALYDARFAKPVDIALIADLVEQRVPILTVEDHFVTGGFGSAVLEACHGRGLPTTGIHRLGMAEKWVAQNSRRRQLADAGLDAPGIARTARLILDENTVLAAPRIAVAVNAAHAIR
jgi:1-deoxy-D-xylulose-5-phosphate synthase